MWNQSEEPNYLCSELVSVLYEDKMNHTRSTVANLERISATSATLLTDEPLEPGDAISFAAKGFDLYGRVESVDADQTLGYFTKIELDRNSRWHGRMFVPEHFLALCVSTRPNHSAELPLSCTP